MFQGILLFQIAVPLQKLSGFLDHHLQPIMKAGKSYIKDRGNFLEKLKYLGNIPSNNTLVTVNIVGHTLVSPTMLVFKLYMRN